MATSEASAIWAKKGSMGNPMASLTRLSPLCAPPPYINFGHMTWKCFHDLAWGKVHIGEAKEALVLS